MIKLVGGSISLFNQFCLFFLLFFIYSFFGWAMEVICKLIEKHKFINRGFLIGPYCPIYGWGCLFIIIFLDRYKDNIVTLFVMSIVICSILEYLTSYVMEKVFKTRWWDYSQKKFNINGRICLETMVPFGILGCLVIYLVNPFFVYLLSFIPTNILHVTAIILLIIFVIDTIISSSVIFNLRNTIKNVEKDATEEITTKIKEIFTHKGILQKRLIQAFPNMKNRKEKLLELKMKISKELEKYK